MSGLLVLCPSHQRPLEARRLYETFHRTATLPDTRLVFLVWADDATAQKYESNWMKSALRPEESMTARSNAGFISEDDGCDAVGWVADDNRFATVGWDEIVLHALRTVPIVFGNDVASPGSKPSHVFLDARIPRALGWFLHPDLVSTFHDDVFMHLGTGADTARPLGQNKESGGGVGIAYMPSVLVPHLYTERDNSANFQHDALVYQAWRRNEAEDDIAKAKRALRSRRNAH